MDNSALLQKNLRVIVVDSNRDSRELLLTLFATYGVEAVAVSCVSKLFETMQNMCPDLLISELLLPDEDGYSLIHQLKAFETEHHVQIPAIALTVCAKEEDRSHALAAGFREHLTKPLNVDTLIEAVASITQPLPEHA